MDREGARDRQKRLKTERKKQTFKQTESVAKSTGYRRKWPPHAVRDGSDRTVSSRQERYFVLV